MATKGIKGLDRIRGFIAEVSKSGASDIHIHTDETTAVRINGELVHYDMVFSQGEAIMLIMKHADRGEEVLELGGNGGRPNIGLNDGDFGAGMVGGIKEGITGAFGESVVGEFKEGIVGDFKEGIVGEEERIYSALRPPEKEKDLAVSIGDYRYRANVYRLNGSLGLALRVINDRPKSMEELGLPEGLKEIASLRRGLFLVTGPTGSGKSTTLAAIIDYINKNLSRHIITIEDPIEYVHANHKSLITQRELCTHTESFHEALRAALRQDPDIILIGELRDAVTLATALEAAETGHLVLSTMHTSSAAETVGRIIDMFDASASEKISNQLSSVLAGAMSQYLIPDINNKSRVMVYELMLATNAIKNLIREGKLHQIKNTIRTSSALGMVDMDKSLRILFEEGKIDERIYEDHREGR